MTEYFNNVRFAESFLEKHGDNWRGVGWTKRKEDVDKRYEVMLELIRNPGAEPVDVLDFGCGASGLLEYMRERDIGHVNYHGLDISQKFLALSREKFPEIPYYEVDVMQAPEDLPSFDYVIMNGIFNSRWEIPLDEMQSYFETLVQRVFERARVGIAFNVMSKQVEWEREDLFHLPFDTLADYLARDVSRHFVIRHDYGLYEYTAYVYHQA